MNNDFSSAKKLRAPSHSMRSMAGLSLVELMISVALGLIILAAVTSIFVNTSASRNEIERTSRQIENGRYAVELLSDDLRMAGFFGELNVATVAAPGAVPSACATAIADLQAAIPLHLQGYPGGTGAPSCVPAIKTGTDIAVVRRVRACTAGVAGCPGAVNGRPYLQVSLCDTEAPATPYVLGLEGTATYSLRIRTCGTALAGKRQYLTNIYFVSDNNGAGQNVPTLKRLEFTGSGFTETPLVEGIEFFRISYGIDTDGDGLPDVYTPDPANYVCATCTPVENWRNVVTAKIAVLARNIDTSPGYIDAKTYNLGLDAAGNPIVVGPFNNAYRRHVYTSLIRVVNPAGRRDTP